MLFPEARIIGAAGLGEITKWSVATIAGLGAYDTVAGATSIGQISPASGSMNVTTALDADLNFNFSILGSVYTPRSWSATMAPPGTLINTAGGKASRITGRPTQIGSFDTVIRAWQNSNATGNFFQATFTITVGPAIIASQPASTNVTSGGSTTLSVVGSGSPLTYQWFQGTPTSFTQISGATSASFTTPSLITPTSYFVRVTRGTNTTTTNTVNATSSVATVNIVTAVPSSITSGPEPVTLDRGESTTLSVTAAGTAPLTYQWYQGTSGVTTTPVGSNQATFTPSPALSTTTSYWVRVTNSANTSGANSSTATVTLRDLFQTWQNSLFTAPQLQDLAISGPQADPDGDGISNENEYLFGLAPLVSDPSISPSIRVNSGQLALSFTATAASGSGYFGKTRHFTLQSSTDLTSTNWTDVADLTRVQGTNQVVNFTSPIATTSLFYRVKVELQP